MYHVVKYSYYADFLDDCPGMLDDLTDEGNFSLLSPPGLTPPSLTTPPQRCIRRGSIHSKYYMYI